MSFAFHGLGPLYWPRLTPKAAQKFGVTSPATFEIQSSFADERPFMLGES